MVNLKNTKKKKNNNNQSHTQKAAGIKTISKIGGTHVMEKRCHDMLHFT